VRQAANDGVIRMVDLLDRARADGDRALSTLVCKALYNLCTCAGGREEREAEGQGAALWSAREVQTLAGVLERAVDATRAAMSQAAGEEEEASATQEEEAAEAAAFAELALQLHATVLQVDCWEDEGELVLELLERPPSPRP
jgi:hypothetical protein